MDYQLWLGDCLEQMDRIESGSVDMILADLPYNVTNCHWDILIPFEPLWKQYKRVIKKNGAVVLFGSEPFSSLLVVSNLEWFKYEWVWLKNKKTGHLNARIMPMMGSESVIVFGGSKIAYNPQMKRYSPNSHSSNYKINKPGTTYGDVRPGQAYHKVINTKIGMALPDNILRYDVELKRLHPNQKPVKLLEFLIKTYTNEGETVLDNTMGSGSTGEACLRTGRRFIGIEKDAGYFEIGKARMERVTAELHGELNHLPMFQEAIAV